jgi:hypothetical protein
MITPWTIAIARIARCEGKTKIYRARGAGKRVDQSPERTANLGW